MSDLLLAVDPSSTRTGWAVLALSGQLRQAGILNPDKARVAAEFRVADMARDLRELLDEWQPVVVVIEHTSGKVGLNRHGGAGAGLAIYGFAIGALWQTAADWQRSLPAEAQARTMVKLITENEWTRGIPKEKRQAAVAAEFTAYDPSADPGGDIADAIGLGLWYTRERMARMLQEAS